MQPAQMVLFVCLVVRAMLRELWRSVWVESGALFVMTGGVGIMQQLSANSWGSKEQVRCFNTVSNVKRNKTMEFNCLHLMNCLDNRNTDRFTCFKYG